MSTSEFVVTELKDHILSIRLNRADKKNALTQDMYLALTEALNTLTNTPEARVGFITGTPECFSAGNDLLDFMNNPPQEASTAPVFVFLKTLLKLEKPLVAAVNGPAVGIGTTLLLHCDLVYATPDAKMQLPFANLGACPEAASSLILPHMMGHQKASELLMLGGFFSGEDAKQMGIVNDTFDADSYQDKAYEVAQRLVKQPASSMRATKMLMKRHSLENLEETIDVEAGYFSKMIQSPEAREAIQAFMEKRQPDFTQFS